MTFSLLFLLLPRETIVPVCMLFLNNNKVLTCAKLLFAIPIGIMRD